MGIATWMMGKMMDRFLALPPQEKAQVIGTMAEKFWAAATPEETARVAEILMPRFVKAFLEGASDARKQDVLRAMLSPETVQAMVAEAAPKAAATALSSQLPSAVEAWFRGLGDEQKRDLFGDLFAKAMPPVGPPPRPPKGGMMGGMMGGGPWG